MATHRRILIVAPPGDSHADLVEMALLKGGLSVFRISLNTLHSTSWTWLPNGNLSFYCSGTLFQVERNTVVWWRRLGRVKTDDLDSQEAELVIAEFMQLLRGIFMGSGLRFIDEPSKVDLAENKLYQLRVARDLGLSIPETMVTNCLDDAQDFIRRGPVVAKAVSSGLGLAPFVQEVSQDLLALLLRAPTLLQRALYADADVRLVTVGEDVFAWRRSRCPGDPIDWRLTDPSGEKFSWLDVGKRLRHLSLGIVKALGLSTSVQDWLLVSGRYVFLEVNPQGQWAFLQQARETVLPSFVRHLAQQNA